MSGRGRLSSSVPEKKIMRNKERNFSPSVFLRELSHAERKLHCLHYGINSEGLKSPTVREASVLDPQSRTANQRWGSPWPRRGLIHKLLGHLYVYSWITQKDSEQEFGWIIYYFKRHLLSHRQRNCSTFRLSDWQQNILEIVIAQKRHWLCISRLYKRSYNTTVNVKVFFFHRILVGWRGEMF